MHDINRPGGSLGRSQACNLALRLYGDKRVTDEVLKTWLDRLFARNGWLSIGRKRPVPHESYLRRRRLLLLLRPLVRRPVHRRSCPTAERPYFQDHLAHILLPLQERDGSWWDYPFYNYHQQYGTAMAVMSLLRCQKRQDAVDSRCGSSADGDSVAVDDQLAARAFSRRMLLRRNTRLPRRRVASRLSD